MKKIYPPPFLKPALSVFMMLFAISFVKAQSIELGGKYANPKSGTINTGHIMT